MPYAVALPMPCRIIPLPAMAQTDICFKDLRVDTVRRCVFRAGRPVALTPQEYALLEVLLQDRNRAVPRADLLERAWGYSYIGVSRTIDVHINRLRRKLGLEQDIQTVFRVGYRLSTV